MAIDEELDAALLKSAMDGEEQDVIDIVAKASRITRAQAARAIQAVTVFESIGARLKERHATTYERHAYETREEDDGRGWERWQRVRADPIEKVFEVFSDVSDDLKKEMSQYIAYRMRENLVRWGIRTGAKIMFNIKDQVPEANAMRICEACDRRLACVAEDLSTPERCLGYDRSEVIGPGETHPRQHPYYLFKSWDFLVPVRMVSGVVSVDPKGRYGSWTFPLSAVMF